MAFRIQDIKSKLEFGGARSTLFNVVITLPDTIDFDAPANRDVFGSKISFLCRAASLPASNLGTLTVPYFGRNIKLGGQRTFDAWSITVINDEDFALRSCFEAWVNAINSATENMRMKGATSSPSTYKTDAIASQFAKDNDAQPIYKYRFEGLFPENVSEISLNWETESIEEFTVSFQYDLWELDRGPD